MAQLDPRNYYRLPWSLTENGISWLEVTNSCNLACEGCYRPKAGGHKSLDQIADELTVFKRERKSDCMSIAGGDPLVHPKIVDIIRMVANGGWKPVINTNGMALTPELLKKLKAAGAFGFTFHVDTSQVRKDSPQVKNEGGHNHLRQRFAEMVAAEGGMSCSFNQTVTSDTLDQVPDVVRWARTRPDIVHTVVFILYREPRLFPGFDYFVGGRKIPLGDTYEVTDTPRWGGTRTLKAADVVEKIREVEPAYEPCAYLNGTEDPDATKWLLATRVCDGADTYGYATPKFMELVQEGHRLLTGKWLSYSSPEFLAAGRSTAMAFSLIDPKMRKIGMSLLHAWAMQPRKLFRKAHLQTFTIIQPVDMLPDGRMSMCDGCPDMTVYNGKLYWSCRLEEIKQYGAFATAAPRHQAPVRERHKEEAPAAEAV